MKAAAGDRPGHQLPFYAQRTLVTALAPPDTRKTPTRSIILLAAAGLASQAQVRVTDSLLPQIAADFGTTGGAAAMVVTTYVIAHGSIQLLIGPVGDRFDKYLAITVMSLASSILVMLCGFANSLPELAVAGFLAGATAGWVIPLSMAYVDEVTARRRHPEEDRRAEPTGARASPDASAMRPTRLCPIWWRSIVLWVSDIVPRFRGDSLRTN
jgi:hypothetical protein